MLGEEKKINHTLQDVSQKFEITKIEMKIYKHSESELHHIFILCYAILVTEKMKQWWLTIYFKAKHQKYGNNCL